VCESRPRGALAPATWSPLTKRTFTIEFPTDGNRLVGRQCTTNDCNKYFKVKPGTGLSKPTQALCPYCGHTDDPSDFVTDEQKEYMLCVAANQVMAEMAQQLKKHEFNIPARGAFGIGLASTWHRLQSKNQPHGRTDPIPC
jgi:hypothetical protein